MLVKRRRSSSSFLTLLYLCILVALFATPAYFLYRDTDGPLITLNPQAEIQVSPELVFDLNVSEAYSNLKSVEIKLIRADQSMELLNKTFASQVKDFSYTFSLKDTKLPDGDFTLQIIAKDDSYANFLKGNTQVESYHLVMDSQPPKIKFLSSTPNLTRGGSGLIAYEASADVKKTGVFFEDHFFPAYKHEKGHYICLFPFPYYLTPTNYVPEIMAEDYAGNISSSRLLVTLTNKVFPDDVVKIDDKFLKTKEEELRKILPSDEPILDLYIRINNEVREANAETIFESVAYTAPQFYWKDTFQRQPRSASRAGFAEARTYYYNNEKIDFQYHTGIDLASVKEDIVRATNVGKVVFADYLGIYGNTVIIDHGRNLQSLYSHLTDIHVNVGDMVEKNADLGTSGITGLAVGDHVHFSFLIGGIPVQPHEWLDASWVRNHITSRMNY